MKRKRTKEENKAARFAGKLHHCAKEVKKAAKKAKDFEIRKLVKRLKGLRAKETAPPELADLEEQLVLLKDIDHETIANTALKTKLRKDKKLSQNEDLAAAIAQELTHLVVPAAPGSNLAKVQGRLLSHKVLAAEVHAVVEDVRTTVFPELKAPAAPAAEDEVSDEEEPARPAKKAKVVSADSAEEDEDEESDADGSIDRRVAFSEDEEGADDGWESGTVHGSDGSDEERSSEDEGGESDEAEDSDDSGAEDAPAKQKQPSSKGPAAKASTSKTGESTFLPSLSVGFTRGDSDASDLDDAEVARAEGGVRKNRRGQRARRAIWEKKYGKNANHVKKQQAAGAERGPQGRRGPRDANGPRDGARKPFGRPQQNGAPRPQGPSAGPQRTSAPSHAPAGPPPRKKDDKPLHPSWEAKRKLKEKQNPALVAPQGKKIVFD